VFAARNFMQWRCDGITPDIYLTDLSNNSRGKCPVPSEDNVMISRDDRIVMIIIILQSHTFVIQCDDTDFSLCKAT
jgi:hypothetical protein